MRVDFDILVAGGGINGAAIARDAAGRGANVLLVERDDLAAHTSSASTKLIHGGLRYLERLEFRMVAKALAERERLMRAAPHLVRPLQFALPHDAARRARWQMRVGLFLYDRLGGGGSLPRTRAVRLDKTPYGSGLRGECRHGFVYADCWGDDSRLVVANAQDAARKGASIWTRTKLVHAEQREAHWHVVLETRCGGRHEKTARALVNATGAWAAEFLGRAGTSADSSELRLVKGSHIVTRRLYPGDHAYILQNHDGRIVFTIPYEREFTLIGTTDVAWNRPPAQPQLDEDELRYLCEAVNRWLRQSIGPHDVIWTYSGLRPLFDDHKVDPADVSRDYVLALHDAAGSAPLLSVFGGKITTHRALAQEALDKLSRRVGGLGPAWTQDALLPGADFGGRNLGQLAAELRSRAPFLEPTTVTRWIESYGTAAFEVLGSAQALADLGEDFGAGLREAEVRYLQFREWAQSSEDIVWRRSKLGLRMTPDQVARLDAWLAANGQQTHGIGQREVVSID